jgi:hypothetical protein
MNVPQKSTQNARGSERRSEIKDGGGAGGLMGRQRPDKQKTLPPFGGQGCFFGLVLVLGN